jgi:hypothetical protein
MCTHTHRLTQTQKYITYTHKHMHTNTTHTGTPALIDPLKDYAQHTDMDYNSAADCGLEGTLDEAYLQARPPSPGSQCPNNPPSNNTAYTQFLQDNAARKTSVKTNLGQCRLRNSACSEFCVTGGIATSRCNSADFDMFLIFNGAEIGMARELRAKVADIVWIGLWPAKSGALYVQKQHQPMEGGPIPEGLWRLDDRTIPSNSRRRHASRSEVPPSASSSEQSRAPGSDRVLSDTRHGAVGLLPCCMTDLFERTTCEAYEPTCRLRFWLYGRGDAEWTDRQGIEVSDREGIYVMDDSFLEALGLVQGRVLLIVDYAAKMRTDEIQLTSNRSCIHTYMCTYIEDEIRLTNGRLCIHTYMHSYVHLYMHACSAKMRCSYDRPHVGHVCISTNRYNMHLCMFINRYIYTYIHIYIYTYIYT